MYQETNALKTIDVLMIDREEKLLVVTKKYFSQKNIRITMSTSLTEAWCSLYRSCPDLIIIDIIICGLSGDNFIQEVQQDRKFKHIPMIFLTAKGLTEDRIKGYKSGCATYLSKPFDPEELESIIRNLVKKKDMCIEWIIQIRSVLKEIKTQLNVRKLKNLHPKIKLTSTEKTILAYLINGKQNQEIAYTLRTSKRHVENYVTRILDKTSTNNTKELRKLPWFSVM